MAGYLTSDRIAIMGALMAPLGAAARASLRLALAWCCLETDPRRGSISVRRGAGHDPS
jgi:hypothetical protein